MEIAKEQMHVTPASGSDWTLIAGRKWSAYKRSGLLLEANKAGEAFGCALCLFTGLTMARKQAVDLQVRGFCNVLYYSELTS